MKTYTGGIFSCVSPATGWPAADVGVRLGGCGEERVDGAEATPVRELIRFPLCLRRRVTNTHIRHFTPMSVPLGPFLYVWAYIWSCVCVCIFIDIFCVCVFMPGSYTVQLLSHSLGTIALCYLLTWAAKITFQFGRWSASLSFSSAPHGILY